MGIIMADCLEIARYFIVRAYEDGLEAEMTNMKVQKLLYYAQSLYLALYDEPLFPEEIQAWRNGPVCPPAYHFYSEFEAQQLPVPREESLTVLAPEVRECLEEVWGFFGGYHAYRLSDMTHGEFPWRKARQGLPLEAPSTEPIALSDLKALGLQKLELMERENPAYGLAMAQVLTAALGEGSTGRVVKGEVHDWLKSLLD
jgi:uncharacterized phage-associated protein